MPTVVDAITASLPTAGSLILSSSGTEIPWADVHLRARQVARGLQDRGIGRGSRIGLRLDSGAEQIAALQGIWLSGAAVTVLPPSNVDAIVADAKLDLVLTGDNLPHGAPADIVRPHPGDLAILQYTSGSTSSPRGVPVTHRQLAANLDAIEAAFDHNGQQVRMMSWLPLYHDMGLIGFLCLPMSRGWPLVSQSPASFARQPGAWLQTIGRYGITVTGAPNFAYRLLTRLLRAGLQADLSSLRFMLCGGEPIDPLTMADFAGAAAECGLDEGALVAAYGLAEATLAVTISAPGAGIRIDAVDPESLDRHGIARPGGARQLVRLGRAVSGTQIRILDPKSREPLPDRQVGLIEVRGPSVTGPPGSWLDTGDLGYLAEGDLVVCGRRKEVLFAAGRNIYPQDVEAVVAGLPGVGIGRVAAFGVAGEHGDRLIIAVESRESEHETGLRQAIAVMVTRVVGLSPAEVVTVRPGRLPKTSSGKIRRSETRRRYLCGELIQGRKLQ